MGRLFFVFFVAAGFVTDAIAADKHRFVPIRRCKNNLASNDPAAIDITILMDNFQCRWKRNDPALDQKLSVQGNLIFVDAVMVLDHISGGILPYKMEGVVSGEQLKSIRDIPGTDSESSWVTFDACQYLQHVILKRKGASGSDLPIVDLAVDGDFTRGAYIADLKLDENRARKAEQESQPLTCEVVNESLLQNSGSIVIPKEDAKVEATTVTPIQKKKLEVVPPPPTPGVIETPATKEEIVPSGDAVPLEIPQLPSPTDSENKPVSNPPEPGIKRSF